MQVTPVYCVANKRILSAGSGHFSQQKWENWSIPRKSPAARFLVGIHGKHCVFVVSETPYCFNYLHTFLYKTGRKLHVIHARISMGLKVELQIRTPLAEGFLGEK